jgi:hypothetical protein
MPCNGVITRFALARLCLSYMPCQVRGAVQHEQALKQEFARGVNVVVDYLWGESAKIVIVAIAKCVEDATPARFIHVGGASREEEIALPCAAIRSSAIQLMGSGVKSIPFVKLLGAIQSVFEAAAPASSRSPEKSCRSPISSRRGKHQASRASW